MDCKNIPPFSNPKTSERAWAISKLLCVKINGLSYVRLYFCRNVFREIEVSVLCLLLFKNTFYLSGILECCLIISYLPLIRKQIRNKDDINQVLFSTKSSNCYHDVIEKNNSMTDGSYFLNHSIYCGIYTVYII